MADSGRRERDLPLVEEFEYVRAVTAEGGSVQVPKSMFGGNLEIANENVLGGIKASAKSETDTQEVKIDPKTGKLFVPKGEGTPPDDEDITVAEIDGTGKLQFKDKKYNSASFSGLGRTYLRKNMVSGVNVLTQAMFTNADGSPKIETRYIIQYDYDLKGSIITIPENCFLLFEGGSLKNGHILGNNTTIVASKYEYIFKEGLTFGGTFNNNQINVCWLGASTSLLEDYSLSNTDVSIPIQRAFDIETLRGFNTVYIPIGVFYISGTLNMSIAKNIELEGVSSQNMLYYLKSTEGPLTGAIIYTDKNIDMLVVDIVKPSFDSSIGNNYAISIKGGQFDVSLAIQNYSSSVLKFTDVEGKSVIWGLSIETSIIAHSTLHRLDGTARGIYFDYQNGGYATMIRTNCFIKYFSYGISDSVFGGTSWATDLKDTSAISCRCAIQLNSIYSTHLGGSYQTVAVFNNETGPGLVELNSNDHYVTAKFWDVNHPTTVNGVAYHTNSYGLVIGDYVENVRVDGLSKDLMDGVLVKGNYQADENDFDVHSNIWIKDDSLTVETAVSGSVSSVNNIDNAFSNHKNSVATSTISSSSEGYLDVTITSTNVYHYKHIGVLVDRFESYYASFKKVMVSIYKDSTLLKTIEKSNLKYSTKDAAWVVFDMNPKTTSANKIVIRFYEPVPAKYGTVNYCRIMSIVANVDEKTSTYLTRDGRGGRYFYDKDNNNTPKLVLAGVSDSTLESMNVGRSIINIQGDGVHLRDVHGWGIPMLRDINITIHGGYGLPAQTPSSKLRTTTYEDLSKGRTYFYRGYKSRWEEYDGSAAGIVRSGTFANKPTSADINIGFIYFCTDRSTPEGQTDGIPIFYIGNNKWVDFLGRLMS